MFLEARRGAVLPRRVPSRTRSVVERGSERRLVEHDNLMKSHTLNRSLTCIMTLAVVLLSLPYQLLDLRSPSEGGGPEARRKWGHVALAVPLAIPYRQGVQQLQRSESALSCPRRLVRVWNCPRCRPRQWLGALPLARRLPISDFRSCFSCSDSQTRTPRGDANSFRFSECLQPWGQGTSWWVPPNKCLAGDAVVRLEVFRFAPLTTPCHGNLETPTIHAHSWRA